MLTFQGRTYEKVDGDWYEDTPEHDRVCQIWQTESGQTLLLDIDYVTRRISVYHGVCDSFDKSEMLAV